MRPRCRRGALTGDVTDVVTDVVSNGGGVTGVVLGDVLGHLADKIGTDISGLGVDASGHTGEESDGGSAGTVASKGFDVTPDEVAEGNAEQTEANNGLAHNGTATEGDLETLSETSVTVGLLAFPAGGGGTAVGAGGHGHADVAGRVGQTRTDDVVDGDFVIVLDQADDDSHDGGEDNDVCGIETE